MAKTPDSTPAPKIISLEALEAAEANQARNAASGDINVDLELARLALLSIAGYAKERKAAAKLLGFSVNWLDKAVAEFRTKEPEPPKKNGHNGHSSAPPSEIHLDMRSGKDPSAESPPWRDRLILDRTGIPRPLLANAITVLEQAEEWKGVLAWDALRLRTVIRDREPPWSGGAPTTASYKTDWGDNHDLRTCEWLQLHAGVQVPPEITSQAINAVASEIRFHPVLDYLFRLRWDKTPRLDHWLIDHFGVEDSPYAREVGAKWMISAIARVAEPGCKADHMLILEGAQGKQKSTALRTLVGGAWFTDQLDDIGSKDAAMQLAGVWVIEMAELDHLDRTEVRRVKAFLSRQNDRFRPPWGRRVVDQPRQCIFAGTANNGEYLKDETGNRRFWPVTCGKDKIDIESLGSVRDQLWAEAMRRYLDGEHWWIEDEELTVAAREEQAARYQGDTWEEIMLDWLNLHRHEKTTVADILRSCLKVGARDQWGEGEPSKWSQADQNRVGKALRALGWERRRVGPRGGREYVYIAPSVADSFISSDDDGATTGSASAP